MESLYERIGGEGAVDAAVERFYTKVVADERIKHFFDGADLDRLKTHQKRFLTYAFGGAPDYPGASMKAAHSRLVDNGLVDAHFDAVMENLGATLQELGVADDLIAEAAGIAESTRDDVLGRSA